MAFEFKFATLLRHRKRLEEVAQREYLWAREELDACLAEIQAMYDSIEETRNRIIELQKSGEVAAVLQSETFIVGQRVRIDRAREVARQLMTKVEERQEMLVEAAREFKKIDKLRERMFADYRKGRRKREMKVVDDLVVMRAGRGEKP